MKTINTAALGVAFALALAFLSAFPVMPATAALPPRPTLTPIPLPPTALPPTALAQPTLATIVLSAGPAYDGGWSVVQWQGGDGAWHDVTGWRGQVRIGQMRWRVAPKDFNTGPFRWLVYDDETGEALGVSPPFTLPSSSNYLVTVEVSPALGE